MLTYIGNIISYYIPKFSYWIVGRVLKFSEVLRFNYLINFKILIFVLNLSITYYVLLFNSCNEIKIKEDYLLNC